MKVRMRFSKAGTMKYIGHLDVMRFFQKTFRRADLDMMYSQGYNPHPLLSFASPLGVGLTSDGEYLDIQLASCDSSDVMMEKVNAAMAVNETTPSEIRIESVKLLPDDSKAAMALVAAADYLVSRKDGYAPIPDFEDQFEKFLDQESIVITKETKSGEAEVDLRPWIYATAFSIEDFSKKTGENVPTAAPIRTCVAEQYENGQKVYLRLSAGSSVNIKPEQVMEAFVKSLGLEYEPFGWQLHRIELYAKDEKFGFIPLDAMGSDIN